MDTLSISNRSIDSVWEGRYKASLVGCERHMLRCYRYIKLNSVRAGMVSDPVHYRWSSYPTNALGQRDP